MNTDSLTVVSTWNRCPRSAKRMQYSSSTLPSGTLWLWRRTELLPRLFFLVVCPSERVCSPLDQLQPMHMQSRVASVMQSTSFSPTIWSILPSSIFLSPSFTIADADRNVIVSLKSRGECQRSRNLISCENHLEFGDKALLFDFTCSAFMRRGVRSSIISARNASGLQLKGITAARRANADIQSFCRVLNAPKSGFFSASSTSAIHRSVNAKLRRALIFSDIDPIATIITALTYESSTNLVDTSSGFPI